MAKQATDTFVTVMPDGTERMIVRGQVLQDSHEIVRHVPALFIPFDAGQVEEPEAPVKRGPGRPRKDAS